MSINYFKIFHADLIQLYLSFEIMTPNLVTKSSVLHSLPYT